LRRSAERYDGYVTTVDLSGGAGTSAEGRLKIQANDDCSFAVTDELSGILFNVEYHLLCLPLARPAMDDDGEALVIIIHCGFYAALPSSRG
jgi:hypothetical protein